MTEAVAEVDVDVEIEEAPAKASGGGGLSFECKKFALQNLIEAASSVIPSRDLVPVLKNFLVEVSDGELRVTATDLELAVVATTGLVTVHQEGSAVFPAATLLEILREANDKPVQVEVKGQTAFIVISPTAWEIKLADVDDYPPLPVLSEIEFVPHSRAKFVQAIRAVHYAASRETHRANLMLIDISGGRARASDGVRFQQIEPGADALPLDCQVPIAAVDDLLRLLKISDLVTVDVGQSPDKLIFRFGSDVFIVSKFNAQFPDMEAQMLRPAM